MWTDDVSIDHCLLAWSQIQPERIQQSWRNKSSEFKYYVVCRMSKCKVQITETAILFMWFFKMQIYFLTLTLLFSVSLLWSGWRDVVLPKAGVWRPPPRRAAETAAVQPVLWHSAQDGWYKIHPRKQFKYTLQRRLTVNYDRYNQLMFSVTFQGKVWYVCLFQFQGFADFSFWVFDFWTLGRTIERKLWWAFCKLNDKLRNHEYIMNKSCSPTAYFDLIL